MFGIFSRKQKLREEDFAIKVELIKNEASERIAVLERALQRKSDEVESLLRDREILSNGQRIREKQEDIIEKNLKDLKRDNDLLKEKVALLSSKSIFNPLPAGEHLYRIPLERYFTSSKYEAHIETLKALGKNHMCEIAHEDLLKLTQDKNSEEMRKQYRKFLEGHLDMDTKILAIKGEKIAKVYNKNRKFVAFANENNLEFMDDIKDFNFYTLIENDFKSEMIEELISKNMEYHKGYRK